MKHESQRSMTARSPARSTKKKDGGYSLLAVDQQRYPIKRRSYINSMISIFIIIDVY